MSEAVKKGQAVTVCREHFSSGQYRGKDREAGRLSLPYRRQDNASLAIINVLAVSGDVTS